MCKIKCSVVVVTSKLLAISKCIYKIIRFVSTTSTKFFWSVYAMEIIMETEEQLGMKCKFLCDRIAFHVQNQMLRRSSHVSIQHIVIGCYAHSHKVPQRQNDCKGRGGVFVWECGEYVTNTNMVPGKEMSYDKHIVNSLSQWEDFCC